MIQLLQSSDKLSNNNSNSNSNSKYYSEISHLRRSRDQILQNIIENLDDGVIILDRLNQQQVLYINCKANQILSRIEKSTSSIWNICQSLIKEQNKLFQNYAVLSQEIVAIRNQIIRIRTRKLVLSDIENIENDYLLVIIENKSESLEKSANVEATQYRLTCREREVWILYKAKYSYKEIAEKLYITMNTVKKHMKNIHAKRQSCYIA